MGRTDNGWMTGLVIGCAMLVPGCASEENVIAGDPVWSDDDDEVLFQVNWHDVPYRDRDESPSDKRWRNEEFQFYRMPADPDAEPEPLGQRGSNAGGFYYMRTAGYVLFTVGVGDHVEVRQMSLDGDERLVADSREITWLFDAGGGHSMEGIPSPGGEFVALWLNEYVWETAETHTALTVLDVETLETVLPQARLDGGDIVWRADGSLTFWTGDTGFDWMPGTDALTPGARPPCSGPMTTSSDVSSDGRVITAGLTLAAPFRFVPAGEYDRPFGCGE